MSGPQHDYDSIPGTFVFDGRLAQKGYALNKMCFSFNEARNREDYARDEDGYCKRYHLSAAQRRAVGDRNVIELLEAGANIYYLAKWAGIFGLTVQQLGAQQRGMSEEAFKEMLLRAGGPIGN
jgi:protocatechuate 4,5-dioxygenase alpha chain